MKGSRAAPAWRDPGQAPARPSAPSALAACRRGACPTPILEAPLPRKADPVTTISITPNLAWILLAAAGALEVVWAVSMKASAGFTRHAFTAITLVAAWASFALLGIAMKHLPVGTAYAVWTGIGAIGAAVLGILFFGEPASAIRVGCIALIVLGILGLKFASAP